jgi:hypothetical protein
MSLILEDSSLRRTFLSLVLLSFQASLPLFLFFTVFFAEFAKVFRYTFLKLDLFSPVSSCSTCAFPPCSLLSSASADANGISISHLLTRVWLACACEWISLVGTCGSRLAATLLPPPPRQPPLICNVVSYYFVSVTLFLISGFSFRLPVI